jgi:histidyl-tRNA synthetase
LRYDLTAPLARYVAENFDSLPKPYRSYRAGYVYRNEKPGPGRFRQFMQFDADTVGSASPAADAEMCMMAADTMEALGIPRGSYVVKVNNRKVLDGVMESIGLGGEENAGRRLTVLRAIDKLDRLGVDGVKQLLGNGRRDESGDFTKGAMLEPLAIDALIHYLMAQLSTGFSGGNASRSERLLIAWNARFDAWEKVVGTSRDGLAGVSELREIAKTVVSCGFYDDRVRFESSVVRGLEYYTGPVYEVELLEQIPNEKGQPVVFGSVGGGGRYDGLVSRFRGQPVPATGFSIGVSRLQAALTRLGKIDTRPAPGPVVVTVFGGNIADYQRFVAMLREAGIRAELYLGNPKNNLGVQFKYADRRNSPCVVVQGSDEKARGDVVIKDLIMGTEAALFHGAVGTSRADYLEERPAQFSCKEEELIAKVREILARHDVKWG